MWVDTHAHLADERFEDDVEDVLARAQEAGVSHVVAVGVGVARAEQVAALALAHEGFVSAAVGIHPHDADEADDLALARLEELAGAPAVVAVGETGLDYHYENSQREAQKALFVRHIELALKTGLPLVVHCREAYEDCLEVLDRYRGAGLRGVAHCFSGGVAEAERLMRAGFYISFAGPITFPKAEGLRGVAGHVPLERVLIETDSPYLAPQVRRGKRNEPAWVRFVAEGLAGARGMAVEEVARITAENARRLFDFGGT